MTIDAKNFTISFHNNDRSEAEWIYYQLRAAGYSVGMYLWDGEDSVSFETAMRRDAARGERVLVVLSENYLCSQLTRREWTAAVLANAVEGESRLMAVRVSICDMEGPLRAVPYLDLVGHSRKEARDILLANIQRDAQLWKAVVAANPESAATSRQDLTIEAEETLLAYPFSTITLTQLKAAGWSTGRHFDTNGYENLLQEEGYTVFPVVKAFLRRFGGLRIARPSWRFPGSIHWFHFQVDKTVEQTPKCNIEAEMQCLEIRLCLIGTADQDNRLAMVMDPMGNVYIDFLGMHDLGTSGEDAIEALCTNRPIEGFEEQHL